MSEDNITELKLPEEIAKESEEETVKKEEAAVETTEQMAENATETKIVSQIIFSPYYSFFLLLPVLYMMKDN